MSVRHNEDTVDTPRQALGKVLRGSLTSIAIFAMIAFVVVVFLQFDLRSGDKTEMRRNWEGTWVHESGGETSVIWLRKGGSIAASNVPPSGVDTGLGDSEELDWADAESLNGCWDPETDQYGDGVPEFSVKLLGPSGWNDGDISTSMHVEDVNTIYFLWGGITDQQKMVYERAAVDDADLPERLPDIESCNSGYWEDW